MVKISYNQEKTKIINFVIPAIFLVVGIFICQQTMHKPQTDEVARGLGTGESMAVGDLS